jgi:orotidine-5'-phosphate decarboxylase
VLDASNTMSSIRHLADLIGSTRHKHARALQADLLRLQTTYGRHAVSEALALSQQQDLRASLSISGQRQRQRAERQSERMAQEQFRKREDSDGRC